MKKEYNHPFLNWAQAISDWCQITFGFDNFKIARVLKITAIVFFAIFSIMAIYIGLLEDVLILLFFNIILFDIDFMNLKEAEESCKKRHLNHLVIKQSGFRFFWGISFLASIYFLVVLIRDLKNTEIPPKDAWLALIMMYLYIVFVLFNFFEFVSLYFQACTPKPPSESKVRKWINSMKESLSGKRELAPA